MRKPYNPQKRSTKSNSAPSEVKSCGGSYTTDDLPQLLGYGFCNKYGFKRLANVMAWTYYESVSAMMNAVDIRTDNFSQSIRPKILDTETNIYYDKVEPGIPETQVLDLFKNPNADKTTTDLLDAQAKSYEVTGDMYTEIKAINDKRPPVEMRYINPVRVDIMEDPRGGVKYYSVLENGHYIKYHKNIIDGKTRYLTNDLMWELDHMKRFNPRSTNGGSESLDGLSPYSSLIHEIEQFIAASIHNQATLDNGARPSMAVTTDAREEFQLTDEQFNRLEKKINDKYQGVENSGNVMLLDGGKDVKAFSITNKDMDFMDGIIQDKKQIYRNRLIPVAFIDGESKFTNQEDC